MASSHRRTRRGSFAAFRRPFITDLVFWLAAGMAVLFGAVVGGLLIMVVGLPSSILGWMWPAGAFALSGWLAFKLLAMGINTSRALEPGREQTSAARADSMEATGRAAGAVVGKGVRKVVGGRKQNAAPSTAAGEPTPPETAGAASPPSAPAPAAPTASPTPAPPAAPSPTADPAPAVTVDKAARVIGSMVGRRLGDRRKGGGS